MTLLAVFQGGAYKTKLSPKLLLRSERACQKSNMFCHRGCSPWRFCTLQAYPQPKPCQPRPAHGSSSGHPPVLVTGSFPIPEIDGGICPSIRSGMTITGNYPKARFFSFAVYDHAPVSTALADHLFDAQIVPNPGSINPFELPEIGRSSPEHPQSYNLAVTRTDSKTNNVLQLHADTGWLVYRLYLPNAGEGSMGGMPLPSISITDTRGQITLLSACPTANRQSELAALQPQFLPALLESPPLTPPVPDRIRFAPIPTPPVRLLPNPDNKYLVSFFMSVYDPARIIVIRGKMPGFPDTYRGAPVSKPARGFDAVQLRYWSMCLGDLVSPLPIEGCAVDASTPLDENGFYTIVISNDVLRPDWLPPQFVWLPWGDEKMVPKTIFLRNTLPSLDFGQSAQKAIAQGCGVNFNFPTPPTHDEITQAGKCTQNVMGDYYPVAAWCDRADFRSGSWPACFSRVEGAGK